MYYDILYLCYYIKIRNKKKKQVIRCYDATYTLALPSAGSKRMSAESRHTSVLFISIFNKDTLETFFGI